MIHASALALLEKSAHVFALKDNTETVNQLNERKTRLRAAIQDLNGALTTWRLLREQGIIRAEQPQSLAGALRQLEKVRKNAAHDRLSLLTNDVYVTLKNLKTLREELGQESQRLWQEHLDRLKPPIPDALLNVLERQPVWVERVKLWRLLNKEQARLRAPQPINSPLIQQAVLLGQKYAELRKAVTQLDLPAPVMTFLERAGDGRATPADLTAEVTEWLKRHELLTAFSIQLRPS